jgi:S1-C subfamily serine protease
VRKFLLLSIFLTSCAHGFSGLTSETTKFDHIIKSTVALSGTEVDRIDCSGVIVAYKDGFAYILTAKHCMKDYESKLLIKNILAYFNTDNKYHALTLLGIDTDNDLALLKTTNRINDIVPVTLSRVIPGRGSIVFTIGSSSGHVNQLHFGRVVTQKREDPKEEDDGDLIVDLAIDYGGSGGGLFNEKTELVGIMVWFSLKEKRYIFRSGAVRMDVIYPFLNRWFYMY